MSPLRRHVTDKEFSKLYIEKKLRGGKTPKTECILRTQADIEYYVPKTLPLVIKPTHSSGISVLICSQQDYENNKKKILSWLNHDYFLALWSEIMMVLKRR